MINRKIKLACEKKKKKKKDQRRGKRKKLFIFYCKTKKIMALRIKIVR